MLQVLPKISLCMIVKNEESFIGKCLESVRGLVAEVIVVDTGSTDQTIQVCERYGSKIYRYKWKDHFADARNYSLTFASGDWILWLDADETLDQEGRLAISEQLAKTEEDVLLLPVLNYDGQSISGSKRSSDAHLVYQPRLFKNGKDFKFTNRIHESLDYPNEPRKAMVSIQAFIHHHGYFNDVVEAKQKHERNLRLLKLELEEPNHSPWIEYHLASEYYRTKQYEIAFQYVNQSIIGFLKDKTKPPSLLYKLKYGILIDSNNLKGARAGIDKAIALYPDYVDLYFYKGLILYEMENYEEAIRAFEQCVELGEKSREHLILIGTGSFRAWRYIGKCFERLGMSEEAKEAYKKEQQARENKL